MRIFYKSGELACGVNDYGEVFLGDDKSGFNLPDNTANRIYVIDEFHKMLKEKGVSYE